MFGIFSRMSSYDHAPIIPSLYSSLMLACRTAQNSGIVAGASWAATFSWLSIRMPSHSISRCLAKGPVPVHTPPVHR